MTLHLNPRGDRIVCRWTEPVRFRMTNFEGVLNKVRTLNLNVDRKGKLATRDKKRHGENPLFSHAERFRDKLDRINYFSPSRVVCACEECGLATAVVPHFDPVQDRLRWRCADQVACRMDQ